MSAILLRLLRLYGRQRKLSQCIRDAINEFADGAVGICVAPDSFLGSAGLNASLGCASNTRYGKLFELLHILLNH